MNPALSRPPRDAGAPVPTPPGTGATRQAFYLHARFSGYTIVDAAGRKRATLPGYGGDARRHAEAVRDELNRIAALPREVA